MSLSTGRMISLRQLFGLSDEDLEFKVNGIRSIGEYLGLGVMNRFPATPI